jgi:hypothetical protein
MNRRISERPERPVTMDLRRRYWDLHSDPRYALPVDYS